MRDLDLSNAEYAGKTNTETFNEIYKTKFWLRDPEVQETFDELPEIYSGEGSYVESYIDSLLRLLDDLPKDSIIDLGCGDFNVGEKFYRMFDTYHGVDVSELAIKYNAARYPEVSFEVADLADYKIDEKFKVGLLRQVLQHLTNADIQKILAAVNNSRLEYLVVIESVAKDPNFSPNVDMLTGPHGRHNHGSGVQVDAEPFVFSFKRKNVFAIQDGPDYTLVSTLFEL
jgi:SAM-dependent methyltransferase